MGKLVFKTPKLDFKTPKLVFKTPKLLSPALSLQVLGWIPHKKFACQYHICGANYAPNLKKVLFPAKVFREYSISIVSESNPGLDSFQK